MRRMLETVSISDFGGLVGISEEFELDFEIYFSWNLGDFTWMLMVFREIS